VEEANKSAPGTRVTKAAGYTCTSTALSRSLPAAMAESSAVTIAGSHLVPATALMRPYA